ncbi:disulfide bond formation protein B [Methylocapsa palsarum]|uniref:Disulfide bond formation protein DsbB n=1 Tax=Methylocapsa palsarum TaxID=1612308 RepID=A0A1I4A7X9_9HYPH|nr:disulfide bond formation protein B [Methylocapsa palsarum]SFK52522.1 Disulfide bond formation protein DsbB [Methylocapsa palsarum]
MPLTPFRIALAILLIASGSIASAWTLQVLGFAPCELCLKERIPYYVGIALAGAACLLALNRSTALLPAAFGFIGLIFAASAIFGGYHAGVEWGFWPGPKDCTGPLDHTQSVNDFLTRLQTFKAVRCDAVAIRIFGLSLAAWNAVISVALAGLAAAGVGACADKRLFS